MDPKRTKALVALLTALGAAHTSAGPNTDTSPGAAAAKPNIIVIMADDLGYGDVSCYGATAVQTPAIDRLALEGVRFTSGYCSASTCTPTRYSFLTGTRHNQSIHNGIGRIGFYTGGMKARLRDEDLADAWLRQAQHWIEQNRKLQAAVSVLSSRSRVDEAARQSLGLSPVRPEGILRIRIESPGSGIDG